jgi:hypothetical protein
MFTRHPGVILVTLAVLPVVLVGAPAVAPGWAERAGLDWWHLPALERERKATADRDRGMDAERDLLARRMALKDAAVADLIAGRVSLAEVLDLFAEMDRGRPAHLPSRYSHHQGLSDHESQFRNVVEYALNRVTDPAEGEALRRRLAGELSGLIARPGTAPSDGSSGWARVK